MSLAGDPDESIDCPPAVCCGCGADLASAPVTARRRHQVTDIEPAPAPKVTEYVAQAKECAGCGAVSAGELPAHVRARASHGPETCAQAANLVSGHHIPIYRATLVLCQLAGIAVSTGWMAGIRGRAAALVEASGFLDRVRELLKAAPAVHADETPARAAGGTRYVHLACTRYLTCMHTGDRSAEAIDAGQVLPGYQGVIVRDGYAGYGHLTSALHAWCPVHLLRDLKGLYDFEPAQQEWVQQRGSGAAGEHSPTSHNSRSSSPTCPPPRNGHQQTRRPPRPVQWQRLATARPRTRQKATTPAPHIQATDAW